MSGGGADLFGLPNARRAYVEACTAPAPKNAFKWSHPAVYYAGKAAGWQLLASEPEQVALPLFEHHYANCCDRVVRGEQLQVNPPQPLPEKIKEYLAPTELKNRLKVLRAELKL